MSTRVLLIDDHPLFRAGVAAAIRAAGGFEVCAEAGRAQEGLDLAVQHRPDVAVVDLVLHEDDGLKLVRELRRQHPALRIVVLSMLDEAEYGPRTQQAGATLFVSKRAGPEGIVQALQQSLAAPRPAKPAGRPETEGIGTLSERELQVFRGLGSGRSTQEIALQLGVSVKTVESHREGIKQKLGLPHANALVARAALWLREQGLAR